MIKPYLIDLAITKNLNRTFVNALVRTLNDLQYFLLRTTHHYREYLSLGIHWILVKKMLR